MEPPITTILRECESVKKKSEVRKKYSIEPPITKKLRECESVKKKSEVREKIYYRISEYK